MELLISSQTPLPPTLSSSALEAKLTDSLRTVLRRESVSENAEISLVLCDDAFIRGLNAQYRGLDKPTDVLSFGMDAPPTPNPGGVGNPFVGAPLVLGDIVISVPTAVRQSERAGWPLENEIILLAVHGCLHLLGHDDETAAGAALMQHKTVTLLTEFGILPPVEGSHPFFVEYP